MRPKSDEERMEYLLTLHDPTLSEEEAAAVRATIRRQEQEPELQAARAATVRELEWDKHNRGLALERSTLYSYRKRVLRSIVRWAKGETT